jgi:signal peptidase I
MGGLIKKLARLFKSSLLSFTVLLGVAAVGLSLSAGGRQTLSVQTGSMEPAIKTGSLISINRVSPDDIAVGDVITYTNPRNGAQTITHRVIEVIGQANGPKQFVTKGDANQVADRPISERHVVGRVEADVPHAGKVRDFLNTWPGIILFVYIPSLIVVVSEIRRLAAYYRSQYYALPDFLKRQPTLNTTPVLRGLALVAAVGSVFASSVLPVQAAFMNTARLTGNTISMEKEDDRVRGVVIRKVFVECERNHQHWHHHGHGNKKEVHIVLRNEGDERISLKGWYVTFRGKKLLTFKRTTIRAHDSRDVELPLTRDLAKNSGTIRLRNADGELIDQKQWNHRAELKACWR